MHFMLLEVCEDTNNGLTDKDYNGCNWYKANKSGCGDYDVNGGFVSNQMCCACEGGKTSGNSGKS